MICSFSGPTIKVIRESSLDSCMLMLEAEGVVVAVVRVP